MSAAMTLSEAGQRVLVLEKNSVIGGRTSSWHDAGMHIESGLHRFLGFYDALPRLIEKSGVQLDDIVCWENEIEIRLPDGLHATLGLAPLHKPFQTIWNVLGHHNFLSPADKLQLGKMFAAGFKLYQEAPHKLDTYTVEKFAREHGVSKEAIGRLLVPLTEGIFFVNVKNYSMYALMGLFVPYASRLHKLRVGAFKGGMTEVMMQPMAEFVRRHGGEVQCNQPVGALLTENGRVVGVRMQQGEHRAAHVILAASLAGAQEIIKKSFPDTTAFSDLLRLDTMPAVTFQIELLKPAMQLDRTTFGPGTHLASFAEQSRTTFQASPGRLSIILSPPHQFMSMETDKILDLVQKDLLSLGIDITGQVKDYRKVVLAKDFYALTPGNEKLRPNQRTSVVGLTLAGDYTKQQYLATMEGAVVSGQRAAELILNTEQSN